MEKENCIEVSTSLTERTFVDICSGTSTVVQNGSLDMMLLALTMAIFGLVIIFGLVGIYKLIKA